MICGLKENVFCGSTVACGLNVLVICSCIEFEVYGLNVLVISGSTEFEICGLNVLVIPGSTEFEICGLAMLVIVAQPCLRFLACICL